MLITKKMNENDGVMYPDAIGVPFSLYQRKAKIDDETGEPEKTMTLFETMQKGFYSDYDIIVWRKEYDKSQSLASVKYWYKVWKATEKIDSIKDGKEDWYVESIDEPYGDFEMGLKKYNLQLLCQPTSYRNIKKWFGKTLQAVDKEFGTHFSEELKLLVQEEENSDSVVQIRTLFVDELNQPVEDEETESKPVQEKSEKVGWSEEPPFDSSSDEEKKEEPKRVVRRSVSKPVEEKSIFDKAKEADFDLSVLSDESVSGIKDVVNGELHYTADVDTTDMAECPECGFVSPTVFEGCINCGVIFG